VSLFIYFTAVGPTMCVCACFVFVDQIYHTQKHDHICTALFDNRFVKVSVIYY